MSRCVLDRGSDELKHLTQQPEKTRVDRKTTSPEKWFFYRLVRPKSENS